MIEININELRERMLKQGKEQEFDKLMNEYNNKENQTDFIEIFGEIDEENKLTLTEIFDIDRETYKFIRSMELEERDTIEEVFLEILGEYMDSNWHIKYALLNPTRIKNYFEIALE